MQARNYCLQCDDGTELIHGVQDVTITVRGQNHTVSAVSGWHCPRCGECEFDENEGRRFSAEVDRQIAEAEGKAIRSTRKKPGLKQAA